MTHHLASGIPVATALPLRAHNVGDGPGRGAQGLKTLPFHSKQ